jgi:hypothetical protein
MKSLDSFKNNSSVILEEEKSDYSKFDMLVRAGLANRSQLQRLHRILDKMQEERPVFNPTDRTILQNLFNKMIELISTNKQIFQQTRRAVREELEEGIIDSSTYKLSPSGRKIRTHQVHIGSKRDEEDDEDDKKEMKEEIVLDEQLKNDPPPVLLLKRKAIRFYPNNTRIALYYNDRLRKYFSVPYSLEMDINSPIQAESVELEESVMDHIHKIAKGKHSTQRVKFANGETRKIDHFTASAISKVHNSVNDENKKKLSDMIHKSPAHLMKVAEFAFSKIK